MLYASFGDTNEKIEDDELGAVERVIYHVTSERDSLSYAYSNRSHY